MDYYIEYNDTSRIVITNCSCISNTIRKLENQIGNKDVFNIQKIKSVKLE